MKKNVLEYKGYLADVEFDADSLSLHGVIAGIDDYVDFQATDAKCIVKEFHSAVDDYLAFCEEVGKQPQDDITVDPFEEYIRNLPPTRKELSEAWSVAIGLQAVDGLTPSPYLYEVARKNIDGEITLPEASELVDRYYEDLANREAADELIIEADKVATRIPAIIATHSFSFTPTYYQYIHRELFRGVYSHAGKLRDRNITKSEWVLDHDTVVYSDASELQRALEYDMEQEQSYSYSGSTMDEVIHHLAEFVARLWQIHAFGEGNTRTTAVFLIKYLRYLGFNVNNTMFATHAWYFRNSLVRANYSNLQKKVYKTTEYLEKFLRDLLLGEKHELKNREMHISGYFLSSQSTAHHRPSGDPINDLINDPINALGSGTSPAPPAVAELTTREQQIIGILRNAYAPTVRSLALELGCSDSTVKRTLQAMVRKGVIRRVGSNKKGEWIILTR